MSEKRFKKGLNLSCVDTETGKSYWYACNLCGLLNEFELKCYKLEKENEQLKKELLIIKKTISSIQKEINNYYNEVCSNE